MGSAGALRRAHPSSGHVGPGGGMAWKAACHGSHAICVAWAQNANGLALSTKRLNASKEGTACRMIDICSALPPGDRRCVKPVGPSAAREIGTFSLKTRGPQPQEVTGKYVVVWEKVGGDWKLAADIWNEGK
jgi:hypothetical protein